MTGTLFANIIETRCYLFHVVICIGNHIGDRLHEAKPSAI